MTSGAELWCFSDERLNQRLHKQWSCRWFDTRWRPCDQYDEGTTTKQFKIIKLYAHVASVNELLLNCQHWSEITHSSEVLDRLVPALFAGCRFCFVCAALRRVSLSIASFRDSLRGSSPKKSMFVGPLPRWSPCPMLPYPSCNVAIYCNSTEAVSG